MNEDDPKGPEDKSGRRQRSKRIGDQLRRYYDVMASEAVPDEFLKLLDQADKASKKE